MERKQTWIRNNVERKRVYLSVLGSVFLFVIGLFIIEYEIHTTIPLHSKAFKHLYINLGGVTHLPLILVLSLPILTVLVRKQWAQKREILKKTILQLTKQARMWHVPIAILMVGVIGLHGISALINGWEWDWFYLSGLFSLIILLFLLVAGVLRYRQLDRRWHYWLGVVFFVVSLLHSI